MKVKDIYNILQEIDFLKTRINNQKIFLNRRTNAHRYEQISNHIKDLEKQLNDLMEKEL